MRYKCILTFLFILSFNLVFSQHQLADSLIKKGIEYRIQGKNNKSVRTIKKAIKLKNTYDVYYQYAYSCLQAKKIEEAYQSVVKAISKNPIHAESHLLLSKIMIKKGARLYTLLSLYFFLALEPNSEKSAEEFDNLKYYVDHVFSDDPVLSSFNHMQMDYDDHSFYATEMFMNTYMLHQQFFYDDELSEMEKFIMYNHEFFSRLDKMKGNNRSFWWDFYVPFFQYIVTNDLTTAFTYHVSLSSGKEVEEWVEKNHEEYLKFSNWLSGIIHENNFTF